jgi:hypothetical protein
VVVDHRHPEVPETLGRLHEKEVVIHHEKHHVEATTRFEAPGYFKDMTVEFVSGPSPSLRPQVSHPSGIMQHVKFVTVISTKGR